MQHYVIKFVSGLRQVGGFLRFPLVSSPYKTHCHNITEILLKVALNTMILIHPTMIQYYDFLIFESGVKQS